MESSEDVRTGETVLRHGCMFQVTKFKRLYFMFVIEQFASLWLVYIRPCT